MLKLGGPFFFAGECIYYEIEIIVSIDLLLEVYTCFPLISRIFYFCMVSVK